jgi:hypothetical protein
VAQLSTLGVIARMKRPITIFIAFLFVVLELGLMIVRQYYTWDRPASPQIDLGQTVAVQLNYGKLVYVTPAEKRMLIFTDPAFLVCVFFVFILVVFTFRKSKP